MNLRTFALTYPQLMSQAIVKKWPEEKLIQLRKAYETAERLFDGLYRGQHVPFICHLVRTASILLAEGAPAEVVSAGLVHAAYAVGCFQDMRHGKATAQHRSELEAELGIDVESLAFDYDRFRWYTRECIQEHLDKFNEYKIREKQLILMRLANELEDYLDFGMAYRGSFPYRDKIESYGQKAIELARHLGHPKLAGELTVVFEAHLDCRLPAVVVTNERSSFQLPALKWLKKSFFEKLQSKGAQLIKRMARAEDQLMSTGVSNE